MKIIYSKIFKQFPELVFGISTKFGSNSDYFMNQSFTVGDNPESVKKNRKAFFDSLNIPPENVTFQKQTHSVNSMYVSKPEFFQDCDAIYTDKKENYLAVSIADCTPVFLYEPINKIIAGIHSGWKGTANRITSKTINILIEKYGFNPSNIFAFIGPSISIEHFEVGAEVAELFSDEVKNKIGSKYFIDLKKDNYFQLLSTGLKKENIEISNYCTYRDSKLFHSYRRDREKSGRMLGVIGMR